MNMTESNQTFQCKFGEVINLSEQEKKDIQEQAYKDGYDTGLADGKEGHGNLSQYLAKSRSMAYAFFNEDISADEIEALIPREATATVTDWESAFYGSTIERIPNLSFAGMRISGGVTNSKRVDCEKMYFVNCKSLVEVNNIDWSQTGRMLSAESIFSNCASLKVGVYGNFAENGFLTKLYKTYINCKALETIPYMDMRHITIATDFVNGCTNLQEVWLKNVRCSITLASGTTYGHLIKDECIVRIIGELIKPPSSTRTLTIGSANLAKLTTTYVRLVDITDDMAATDPFVYDKLPFEVCESTDEGAMLISNYMSLKKWQLK
jgi:hypothetical protein